MEGVGLVRWWRGREGGGGTGVTPSQEAKQWLACSRWLPGRDSAGMSVHSLLSTSRAMTPLSSLPTDPTQVPPLSTTCPYNPSPPPPHHPGNKLLCSPSLGKKNKQYFLYVCLLLRNTGRLPHFLTSSLSPSPPLSVPFPDSSLFSPSLPLSEYLPSLVSPSLSL